MAPVGSVSNQLIVHVDYGIWTVELKSSGANLLKNYEVSKANIYMIQAFWYTDPNSYYYTSFTLLTRYGTLLARYDTFLARYDTLLARYATLLARYVMLFARCDTLLARYDRLLARYDTLLARYVTLLTRLHASNTIWSQLEIAWKWLKPEKKNNWVRKLL
jgi:hypothetical protein